MTQAATRATKVDMTEVAQFEIRIPCPQCHGYGGCSQCDHRGIVHIYVPLKQVLRGAVEQILREQTVASTEKLPSEIIGWCATCHKPRTREEVGVFAISDDTGETATDGYACNTCDQPIDEVAG